MADDQPVTTNTFSMDCPTCGPGTIHFLDGEMVPHGCDYEPPSLVLRCEGEPMPLPPRSRRAVQSASVTVVTALIVAVAVLVVLTPIMWAVVEFWRWVL